MDFGSKFVLANDEEEYESMCEEEFEEGMHVSDSSSSDEAEEPRARSLQLAAPTKSPKKKRRQQSAKYHWRKTSLGNTSATQSSMGAAGSSGPAVATKRRFRKADTNVVSVNFDTVLAPGNMYAGDATVCPQCSAILSHISTLETHGDQKIWKCEFCGECVPVDLEPEEIPGTEDVTYLLNTAPATASSSLGGQDRSLVVFCVDTSGSMCVTSEISGNVKLRGTNQLQRLQSFRDDGSDQFLPSQRDRSVTYVSRLQAMQAAVDSQLAEMALKHPERRVALIAFNSEVAIMGDGNQSEIIVAGDKLKDLNQLKGVMQESTIQPQAIKDTRTVLGEKIYSLEEGGATALGPALVLAVQLASSHPGSKVILCTDGKANVGLGRLEVDSGDDGAEMEEQALEFYTSTAEEAAEKGVTVSVITIQGTDCKLVHLGTLADKTGGQVNIVDPMKLTEEFGNILADPIIATKVKATFLLHKQLYVVDDANPDDQASRAVQNIGNVKKSSTITFEFAKKREKTEVSEGTENSDQKQDNNASDGKESDEAPATAPAEEEGATAAPLPIDKREESVVKEYPFQLQVEYMDSEGNKALRVVTRSLPATTDRKLTEEAVNLEVLGAHAAQRAANLALQGQYSRSRGVALMNQRLAWRQVHSDKGSKTSKAAYKNIFSKIKSMENCLQQRQMVEISERGKTRSDSSSDEEETSPAILPPMAHQQSRSTAPLGRMLPSKKSSSRSFFSSKSKRMHSARSSEVDDSMANVMFQMRATDPGRLSSRDPATLQFPLPQPFGGAIGELPVQSEPTVSVRSIIQAAIESDYQDPDEQSGDGR